MRLLTILGSVSVALGAFGLVVMALDGASLSLFGPAGGAWGGLAVGLAVLAVARSRADA